MTFVWDTVKNQNTQRTCEIQFFVHGPQLSHRLDSRRHSLPTCPPFIRHRTRCHSPREHDLYHTTWPSTFEVVRSPIDSRACLSRVLYWSGYCISPNLLGVCQYLCPWRRDTIHPITRTNKCYNHSLWRRDLHYERQRASKNETHIEYESSSVSCVDVHNVNRWCHPLKTTTPSSLSRMDLHTFESTREKYFDDDLKTVIVSVSRGRKKKTTHWRGHVVHEKIKNGEVFAQWERWRCFSSRSCVFPDIELSEKGLIVLHLSRDQLLEIFSVHRGRRRRSIAKDCLKSSSQSPVDKSFRRENWWISTFWSTVRCKILSWGLIFRTSSSAEQEYPDPAPLSQNNPIFLYLSDDTQTQLRDLTIQSPLSL